MFEKIKYNFAQSRAILNAVNLGLLNKTAGELMSGIAGNDFNREYALSLIKSGAVKCKYSAAAAVFARLSASAERIQTNEITSEDWDWACQHAMILAGATRSDAETIARELIKMNK